MEATTIKVQLLHKGSKLPQKAHPTDAGYDLCYCPEDVKQETRLGSGTRSLFACGFAMELPPGYEAQIRTRSGLAMEGLIVLNSPGTVDSGYRGEVKVLLCNTGPTHQTIRHGDRIAQMVIQRLPLTDLLVVGTLAPADRGANAFGSTGRNDNDHPPA